MKFIHIHRKKLFELVSSDKVLLIVCVNLVMIRYNINSVKAHPASYLKWR